MKPTITYYTNGQIESKEWKNEAGQTHRLDGPAYQECRENGQLWVELWYVNGVRHRLDGPAIRYWYKTGRLEVEVWHINGVKYKTEAEFQVAVDLYKANEIAELF